MKVLINNMFARKEIPRNLKYLTHSVIQQSIQTVVRMHTKQRIRLIRKLDCSWAGMKIKGSWQAGCARVFGWTGHTERTDSKHMAKRMVRSVDNR